MSLISHGNWMNFQWKWICFQHKATSLAIKKISKNLFQKQKSQNPMSISSFPVFSSFSICSFPFLLIFTGMKERRKRQTKTFFPSSFVLNIRIREKVNEMKISRRNEFSNRFILLNIIRRGRPSVLKQERRRWWCINLTMICEWKWLSSDLLGFFLRQKRCFSKKLSR